jgi:glycosyltransferase involved in cell wall biosynthesis
LNILTVTGTFHPEAGGPATYLYHLLPELVVRGHQVAVITYGDVEKEYEYPYQVIRISRRQSIPLRLAKFTWEVLRQGRGGDLLFVNDYGLPAAVANLVLRKPVVMKAVGDFAWEYAIRHRLIPADENIDDFQQMRHGFTVVLLRRLQRWYVNRARAVIVPSHYFRRIIANWGVPEKKLRVIYNAVDLAAYQDLPSRGEIRARLGLSGRVVLTAARLAPWKGVDRLIAALPAWREAVPEANLVVVGDGPERASLERLARETGVAGAVRFVGQVPHERMPLYLRAAEVFVLYSGYEGLPHVVLEAMAAGIPVVVSHKGGLPEVVEDGVTGLLVKWGDETALTEAVRRVLGDAALARRLGEAGRARVERDFGWARLVERTTALLAEVVAGLG